MIRRAGKREMPELVRLAWCLWREHSAEELEEELSFIMENEDSCFFLWYEGETAVGFAQCQLRRDYVEGTDSSPVGYLEGIFVTEEHRHRGYAREMLRACEEWVRKRGCKEFASDCELDNRESECFHRAMGFQESNRVICFTKKLTS